MQALKEVTAVFCLACVCAEILAQLTAGGWPRRCIKAAAGLYILLSLMYALPQAGAELEGFSMPAVSQYDFGTAEQAVLRQAELELERTAAAQCLEQTGVSVTLDITLVQNGTEVNAGEVKAAFSADTPPAGRQRAAGFLRGLLGAEPQLLVAEDDGT